MRLLSHTEVSLGHALAIIAKRTPDSSGVQITATLFVKCRLAAAKLSTAEASVCEENVQDVDWVFRSAGIIAHVSLLQPYRAAALVAFMEATAQTARHILVSLLRGGFGNACAKRMKQLTQSAPSNSSKYTSSVLIEKLAAVTAREVTKGRIWDLVLLPLTDPQTRSSDIPVSNYRCCC